MTKEEFLIQYVLNRALTADNLDGAGAAVRAIQSWTVIQNELKKGRS